MAYRIVYSLLYLFSLLPLRVLYLFTDFIFLLVYYVIGYRRKVVLQNLTIAFPEKTDAERKEISRKFYRNFTDFVAETIKLFSASDAFLEKRFSGNWEVLNEQNRKGAKSQVHLGHNFNWEMGWQAVAHHLEGKALGVYMPLSNKTFDQVFRKLRVKWGGILLSAFDMRSAILPYRNEPYTLMLAADQSPGDIAKGYWVNFFGKPTIFHAGPEKGARAGNLPVIFCYVHKIKRGYYHAQFELGVENPADLPVGELTKIYVRYLEEKMRLQPENWLWTHKRWKHQWREEYGPVL